MIKTLPTLARAIAVCVLEFGASAPAAVIEGWAHRFRDGDQNYPQAVAVDGDGNVVVTGNSRSSSGGGPHFYTAKYAAADGTLLWEKFYAGPSNFDEARDVAVDRIGNVVVTGGSDNGTNRDYYTAKYSSLNGTLLWEKRYNSPSNGYDFAAAVAVDSSGNAIVTGVSWNGRDNDFYTAKYAAANGALLWEKRFDSSQIDSAVALAIDNSGNVMVTGTAGVMGGVGGPTGASYYTAKYAAADGALLWDKRYSGPAAFYENYARAIALDGSGNAVVTGSSSVGFPGFEDFYTAKYAAANGALLWEKTYNGPGNSYQDAARAVAVDSVGNVMVTGFSYNVTNGNNDLYTAKYAAANGALLWERRYNNGIAQAVAADGSGNVVVTGYSRPAGGYEDFYTAKYADADGTLLWEMRYDGPANGADFVGTSRSLALGPNGMVAITGRSASVFGPGYTPDYATVVYWEKLPPLSIAVIPAGTRIRFFGTAGHSYQVQSAPALIGPWSTNATFMVATNTVLEHLETNTHAGTVFFRTAAQ